MLRLGVIGYGYWGPNVVRNFAGHHDCKIVTVCDKSPAALNRVMTAYPGIGVTTNPDAVLLATDIDAVAIVTPVSYHYELA
ncbi:MAG TPA: oxidoreductase, partial [Nitrospira sp.]|nr:oxidoreductase [Nitrospira sp.]